MTNYFEAIEILKQTQIAIRKADEMIEKAFAPNFHPSAIVDMADPCFLLKAKLEKVISELEAAIEGGAR